MATYSIYDVSNYRFGTKDDTNNKDQSMSARLARMRSEYSRQGMRRTVEAVILVHTNNHPHVLVLEDQGQIMLPGGRLRPGEGEIEGLKRKLRNKLAPKDPDLHVDFEVCEVLGMMYRPNFEPVVYPYLPPHVTRPKELRRLYLVLLPERAHLQIRNNKNFRAVALMHLYENPVQFGPTLSSLPHLLSRLRFNLIQPIQPEKDAAMKEE